MLFGAYVALTLMWSDSIFPISDAPKDGILNWELLIWAGVTAFVVTGIVGLIIDRLVYRRLRDKMGTSKVLMFSVMMIASLGVSMVLRALLFIRFSASTFRFIRIETGGSQHRLLRYRQSDCNSILRSCNAP